MNNIEQGNAHGFTVMLFLINADVAHNASYSRVEINEGRKGFLQPNRRKVGTATNRFNASYMIIRRILLENGEVIILLFAHPRESTPEAQDNSREANLKEKRC